jgi:hypothetical protein
MRGVVPNSLKTKTKKAMKNENEKKKTTKGSRAGKHKPENVLMGAFVTPRKKAITMVTAAVVAGEGSMTISDLLWRGVENIARTVGVLNANGEVAAKYMDAVVLAEYAIAKTKKERQAR